MFFILSKVLGFFALPSNLLITIGLVGLVLLLTRSRRLASWLVVTSLVLLALFGLSPLGNLLMLPLEERFPPWDASHGAPDGVIVLGGIIAEDVSAARGATALNEAAERVTVAVELARRYPNLRIIFSGGTNALIFSEEAEAAFAVRQLEALGVPQHGRERGVLAVDCQSAAGPALAAADLRLPYAARDRGIPGGGLSGRGLSGRLAHDRPDR
jgi:hypothetical protein